MTAAARAAGGVPDDRLVGDVAGAVEHLRSLPGANGRFGVIGHCSGGRHAYLAAREDDGLLYLSGKTAMLEGTVRFTGPLRTRDDLDTGRDAARLCALQLLAAINAWQQNGLKP